jgi:hypothetical protein
MTSSIMLQIALGIVVKNIQSVVRIANIPTNGSLDNLDIIKLLNMAWLTMKNSRVKGKKVFYVNKIIHERLFAIANEKMRRDSNGLLLEFGFTNEPQFVFQGTPIKLNNQILNAEQQVD